MIGLVLTNVPLFADFSRADLDALSRRLRPHRYAKGSLIHAAGAMGGDLYIIESGRVKLQLPSERGQELVFRLLGRNDFFGELSLIDDGPWFGDAIALDECRLLLLAKRHFLDLLDNHRGMSRRLLTIICGRLRHNARFAQELAFLDVPTRLARTLVALIESDGWGWDGDGRPPALPQIEITQSALAAHVGASRETVNKWLGYYERQGYISCKRDSITLLRLEDLRSRAGVA